MCIRDRIRRYGDSKILGSRVWPFGVKWSHRSRDHRTRRGHFPISGQWWPCVYLVQIRRYGFKDIGVTTLTFWGHVTSSVTWPLDSAYVVSYWWSIGTMRLSCTVTEIYSLKVAFAHVKGQKFSTHAPCHVICRQGVQNNHIFGIPKSTLPIHYTTSMRLRWRLRAVYRWNFYTGAFLYFTHLPRSPQWTDLHEILHRGSSRGHNHLFQILCRLVQGFRRGAGSNFAILPLLSRSPLTQGCATARLWQ